MEEIKEAQCASCLKGNLQLYSWIVKSLGCPRCGVFQLKIPLTNRMTWDDFGYFGSDSDARACRKRLWLHGNEQFLQPKLQAESRDANDAIFFSVENMAISSATKTYSISIRSGLGFKEWEKKPSTAQVDFWFSWEQALWCLGLALESLVIMQVIRWSCHMPHRPAASSFLSPNLRNPVWMILPKKYCFWTAWTCSKRNLAVKKEDRLTSCASFCAPEVLESREIDFLL